MNKSFNQMLSEDSEKVGNLVLFAYDSLIAVAGWAAVMILLHGGLRECVFLFSGVFAILTKIFEKQLGTAAKYVYVSIPPIIGAITCAVCSTNDSDSYICITHYYMATTVLSVLYLDLKLTKVNDTDKIIGRNSKVVTESNEKLEDTVKIFKTILTSSDEVIEVTDLLRKELEDIVVIKDQLLHAMEQVNDMSKKSANDSNEISMAIEGQAAEVENILNNMEIVKKGMNCLADVLNGNK